ncbi:tRNA (5-methylaminomethyl-2-thiouridine)(34)-methyltransferase MnmD [Neolewinella agarilytica]|uniref:tRNA U34 5-methylaminomethyl-2-thiouridine-forming methyltransferase MnmC n=1 Tax=Neolewinella agarilytica TaxID=478744 RepID=A0A1H9J0Z0_9BACT|nr:tRNA (5-methylaminomethyl-2-thiouridine)(34)-methyltransferase MnmD [Neolewinella agarilytica]SEQ80407.1 tRNA U34 5-methylaminomethyl-2-thiouridine-forming methyltransferase MnmC [Neolewinella agarilytica]
MGEGQAKIVLTADGSHSVRSGHFGVDYHSVHGAVQESQHVFIKMGLQPLLEKDPPQIRILEMGFGTGLNALLVRLIADQRPDIQFFYRSFEQFPLPAEVIGGLNYPAVLGVSPTKLTSLHEAKWEEPASLSDNFSLAKYQTEFPRKSAEIISSGWADLIFYDAFAPASQPELWEPEAMKECYRLLSDGGQLVTYCAKGQFKRDLKSVGFRVECPAGPPGKREMTRGIKELGRP